MKSKVLVISLVSACVIVTCFVILSHFSVKSKSDMMICDLVNHNIDLIFDYNKFTNCLIISSIIEKGDKVTFGNVDKMKKHFYNFPRSVVSYKLLDVESYKNAIWKYQDISDACYKKDWRDIYQSKKELVDLLVDTYKGEDGFKVDTVKNSQIIYKTKCKIKIFTYRVETRFTSYKTKMCFVKYGGKWLVAEIYSENI